MGALDLSTGSGPVLRDDAADRELRERGFVAVPLLAPREVAELRAMYESMQQPDDQGFVVDYHRPDRDFVRDVTERIHVIWARHLPDLFLDRDQIMSSFVTKFPDEASAVPMHREPTYVAPEHGEAYNIWIPLEDVNAAAGNGVLELLPGTEHLPAWLAGYNTPQLFAPFDAYLRRHARPVEVAAGHALVFHARMFHFSAPNQGRRPRIAFGAVNVPRGAPLVHVVATGRRGRVLYGVDHGFITDVDPNHVLDRIAELYPVVRTVDDDASIDGPALATAIGSDELPVLEPVVPANVTVPDGVDRRPVPSRPIDGAILPTADVGVGPRDVATSAGPGGGPAVMVEQRGGATLVPLTDERVGRLLPGLRTLARGRPEAAAALVLDAGARVTLRPAPGRGLDLSAYECPQVNAGAITATHVAQFDLGCRTTLPGSGPVRIWNDGPGPLWLVVEVEASGGWRARWAARRRGGGGRPT